MRRTGGLLALTIAASASLPLASAGGARHAGPRTLVFKIELPKPRLGTIAEIAMKLTPPPGASGFRVSGNPFTLSIGNLSALPTYIRAAAAVRQTGPLSYDIFIAINAPKGLVHALRLPASSLQGAAASITIGAIPGPTATGTLVRGDACKAFKVKTTTGQRATPGKVDLYQVLGPWGSPPMSIFAFAEAADPACK
jgi:hypothetical protein